MKMKILLFIFAFLAVHFSFAQKTKYLIIEYLNKRQVNTATCSDVIKNTESEVYLEKDKITDDINKRVKYLITQFPSTQLFNHPTILYAPLHKASIIYLKTYEQDHYGTSCTSTTVGIISAENFKLAEESFNQLHCNSYTGKNKCTISEIRRISPAKNF